MNIAEIAKRAGLPAKTIRYYEDIDLIKPARGANGYRVFSEQDLHRLSFLARARALGFEIKDCRVLLALYADQGRSSSDVKAVANAHLAQIDQKIADLKAMQKTLSHLVASCAGDDRPDCPILEGLGQVP